MLSAIIYTVFMSAINRVRGGGLALVRKNTRVFASLCCGVATSLYFYDAIIGVSVAIGYFLWAIPGWGLYFAAATGTWPQLEKEIGFIDAIGKKLVPWVTGIKHRSNYLRGVICMGLRGGIFSLPLFLALAIFTTPLALAVWPLFFLQGIAYFIAGRVLPNKDPIWLAEMIWGACIGSMVALVGVLHGSLT